MPSYVTPKSALAQTREIFRECHRLNVRAIRVAAAERDKKGGYSQLRYDRAIGERWTAWTVAALHLTAHLCRHPGRAAYTSPVAGEPLARQVCPSDVPKAAEAALRAELERRVNPHTVTADELTEIIVSACWPELK